MSGLAVVLACCAAGVPSFRADVVSAVREARPAGSSLRVDAQLSTAAQRHALDMLARHYFDHISPGGGRLPDRLRRAGWTPRARTWEAGEDIEWATGAWATPDHVVGDFLASPPHRRILTDPAYDELGIGVVEGTPEHGDDGVTVVLDFGRR